MTFTSFTDPTDATPTNFNAVFDELDGSIPQVISIKGPLYKGVGDGVTDDTEALEQAINASGGTIPVFLGAGTYKITRPLVLSVTKYSLLGSRTERNGGSDQATTINYRPTSALGPMISVTTTTSPSLDQGPFEHIDIRFDCDDGTYDQGLFKFGDEATAIASQRTTFGARWERCYFNGNVDTRECTSAGVLTRSGQTMLHVSVHFETVFEDCRFIGGDVQLRSYAGDKPMLTRCRSVFANLPFEFVGASNLQVQNSITDVQIEGWALAPITIKDAGFSGTQLRIENTDATLTGQGWFTLPTITVAGTKQTDALTFSASMDDILFPDVSIIKITEGSDEHTALVKTVSGTAVTVYTAQNVLLWTASTATVKRLHGYGILHNSIHDTTFSNVSILGALNSPAFVYHVTNGLMMISNAVEPFGAGSLVQTSLIVGNKFSGVNFLNNQMTFSGCSPYIVADPSHPMVTVSNIRPDYGSRAHTEAGRTAYQTNKRARMGDLFYEKSLTSRVWSWSPKSYTESDDDSPYALALVNVIGDVDSGERIWAWNFRTDYLSATDLSLTDESLPTISGNLRIRFKVKGTNSSTNFPWRFVSSDSSDVVDAGSTTSTTLSGVWQILEFYYQTVPAEWTVADRAKQTGIEILNPTNTDFFVAAVTVEELPLFTPDKVVTLDDTGTPSVAGGGVFKTGGTTAITDFDDGVVGQEITILAEHTVTITEGSPIVLVSAGNYGMTSSDTLVLRMFNDQIWHEISRSVN